MLAIKKAAHTRELVIVWNEIEPLEDPRSNLPPCGTAELRRGAHAQAEDDGGSRQQAHGTRLTARPEYLFPR